MRKWLLLFTFLLLIARVPLSDAQTASLAPDSGPIPAFPGCEGFGCETPGGRGGKVVLVTNLNDDGPGSLREALMMTEPRIIVFKVSGTIHLKSHIYMGEEQSYVTVAGQTAPGDGIAIADGTLYTSALVRGGSKGGDFHDGVFRHLRFRRGRGGSDASQYALAFMLASGSHHIVLDHNSFTWANDQIINHWGDNIHDVTWSWNIVGEGGGQNAGSIFSGGTPHERISYHHNYMAHTFFRNYLVDSGTYDFINNVNYDTDWDYHFRQDYVQDSQNAPDVLNHYFKEGPNSAQQKPFDLIRLTSSGTYSPISLYLSGNKWVDVNENLISSDQESMIRRREFGGILPEYELRSSPHASQPQFRVTTQSADKGKDLVLAQAGPQPLDAVDERLLGDFFDGGSYDANNIGQFPNLQTYNVPADTDLDGMPDDWEIAHGLDPNDSTDHNQDRDDDGYTNIEEWINDPTPASSIFADVPIDHWAHDSIEALYQAGYIAGCSADPLMYCPDTSMTRAESAVFVERGIHGANYTPIQPVSTAFVDVPLWEWFAKWADGLWDDGYTAGCGSDPLIYCPLQQHTRTEGTVFFLRMLHGADYVPTDPVGIFMDVDVNYWGAKWIEAAFSAGLIPACESSSELRFCPDDALDRAMAAYMMVQAKEISLP